LDDVVVSVDAVVDVAVAAAVAYFQLFGFVACMV